MSEARPGCFRLVRGDGFVASIVIDRPAKRNAISLQMWLSLPGLIAEINDDSTIRVAIVRGEGGESFAAGADLVEVEGSIGNSEAADEYMDAVEAAGDALQECRVPLIASIDGFCMGAGVEIALACDFRFASEQSSFGIPPARLGVTYGLRSTRRAIALIGAPATRDLIYTARRIDSGEALSIGLIDKVCERDQLDEYCREYAGRIACNSPFAVTATKRIMNAIVEGVGQETAEIRKLRIQGFHERDIVEGVTAFKEKRSPEY